MPVLGIAPTKQTLIKLLLLLFTSFLRLEAAGEGNQEEDTTCDARPVATWALNYCSTSLLELLLNFSESAEKGNRLRLPLKLPLTLTPATTLSTPAFQDERI